MSPLARAAAVSALVAGAAAGEPRSAADPIANVVLVSIDSLRADHLALYGYPRATTPFLDARARERGAVVFERMVAVAPSCHPAHTAMLTGFYPHEVGVPWCGEDVVLGYDALEETVDPELLDEQEMLRRQPPPLVDKKLSAVRNWLKIADTRQTLAEIVQRRGLATGAFVSIWTLDGRFGYARGFDSFVDAMPEYYGPKALTWLLRDRLGSQRRQATAATIDAALAHLAKVDAGERFFLFLNLADTHVPYAPRDVPPLAESAEERAAVEAVWRRRYPLDAEDEAFARMRRREGFLLDLYDRSIRHTDAQLERLFRALDARGVGASTMVVVTSDHGDSFGQHRSLSPVRRGRLFFEHSVYVWEETQHVPLLVFDPTRGPGVERRGVTVSHVDLVPTILRRLGIPAEELGAGQRPGRDVLTLPEGSRRAYFLTFGRGQPGLLRGLRLEYPRYVGFRDGDVKFFVDHDRFRRARDGRCYLYDLAADPDEKENLCETGEDGKARALRYRQVLVDWYERTLAAGATAGAPPTPGARRR